MTTLIPIPTENVEDVLLLIDPLIEQGVAIDHGRTTKEDVLDPLRRGTSQLWIVWTERVPDAIVITRIREYPKFKACIIDLCVGANRKRWIHLIKKIEEWAAETGCERMEIPFARLGWARSLPEYKKTRILLEKKI